MANHTKQKCCSNVSEDAAARIAELARLPPIEYDRQRKKAAQELGTRVGALDDEVKKLKASLENEPTGQGQPLRLEDPEPWPEPVNGNELLRKLCAYYNRYVVLPEKADVAVSLWTLHSHAFEASNVVPILTIESPQMRCGKSTLVTALGKVTRRAVIASNITAAGVFRTIEKWKPTLLLDETDTFLKGNEEMRGVLDSGHTRDTAYVIRMVGDNHDPCMFSTFTPRALSHIGRLTGTLKDRSIVVRMRRKRRTEAVKKLRDCSEKETDDLIRQCARWANDNQQALEKLNPDIPAELHDRAADNWQPLLAIADLAGGDWPERAREAAKALTDIEGDDDSIGVMLLADIRQTFEGKTEDRISSKELAEVLGEMHDRPWSEWKSGRAVTKPITQNQLARLLNPFGITPKGVRFGQKTPRGYYRDDFEDAFSRYLSPPGEADRGVQSATLQQHRKTSDVYDSQSATEKSSVADQSPPEPLKNKACGGVAVETPEKARGEKVVEV